MKVPLRSVPEGVSAHQIDVVPVFLVHQGGTVTGFLNGLPPRNPLVACGNDFVDQVTGGVWDLAGHHLRGGATRDLDQVATEVVGDSVRVFPQRIVQPAGVRDLPFIPRLPAGWEGAAVKPAC